jgi:outer membrane lipopolysaccharide assembly protein LptE/RlpB
MRNNVAGLILVLMSLMLASSCGYRLSGMGSLVPDGAKTIAVPTFINDTNEPSVDVEVTKAVVDEFIADGRLRVVGLETADLALRGKVAKYEAVALSYTPDAFVQQYQVKLTVDASLEDRRAKKVLWQEKGIEAIFISDYPISYEFDPALNKNVANIRQTKIGKEAAIKKASQDIAFTLRSRVLEGF